MIRSPTTKEKKDYTFRLLPVCLTKHDWQVFADALADVLPQACYYYEPKVFFKVFHVPPPIFHGDHMFRIVGLDPDRLPEAEMHFDPDWKIEWTRPDRSDWNAASEGQRYWSSQQPKLPTFRFEFSRSQAPDAGHPERITMGRYWFFFAPGNRDHLATGHKVLRLFRQVASNRSQIILRGGSQTAIRSYRKVSPYWLGLDAQRWAREDVTRLLGYREFKDTERSWGVRPLDS